MNTYHNARFYLVSKLCLVKCTDGKMLTLKIS